MGILFLENELIKTKKNKNKEHLEKWKLSNLGHGRIMNVCTYNKFVK